MMSYRLVRRNPRVLVILMLFMVAGYSVVSHMQDNSLEEYTLEFGLLLNKATADEVERGYHAVIERAKAVPSAEFNIAVERITNNCEPVRKKSPGIIFSSHTTHNPCGLEFEGSEHDWVAMAEGTAKSTDRDALLAVAAEMSPHAYYLNVGESMPSDGWLLVVGLVAAAIVGVVLLPGCTWVLHHLKLFGVCSTIVMVPSTAVSIMNDQTYDSLLDMPAGTLPSAAEVVNRDHGVAGGTDAVWSAPGAEGGPPRSMDCTPFSGAGMPDGAILCGP